MRALAWPGVPVLPLVLGGGLVLLLVLAIALFAASGFWLGGMLIAGLLLGAMLLMLPIPVLTVVLLLVTFVAQGTAGYFLRFPQAAWLPYLLCLLLAARAVAGAAAPAGHGPRPASPWSSAPVLFLLLYCVALALATLVNLPPLVQVVVGLKNALPIWVAAAIVLLGAGRAGFAPLVWRVLQVVFFVQLPVVLYQHFVIVPRRHDALTTGMDAVVGTFGGLIDAGGANATLVAFTLLVMAYRLALWDRGRAGFGSLLLYWAVGLAIILSGEVKAVLAWLPLVLFWVLRRRVFTSFATAVIALALGAVLVAGTFTAYAALYWQKIEHRSNADLVEKMGYFFDTRNIDYSRGQISRGASIALWAADRHNDVPHRLVGWGPGASRVSATGGLGEVAQRYAPLTIAATGAALLLWDVGLLGLAAFAGLLASLAWTLARASRSSALPPEDRVAADAFAAVVLVFLSLLVYNRSLHDDAGMQLMLALALGFALHWRRAWTGARTGPARRAAGQP
ncbi:hypothetical protein [Rubrivivax gelatinosus]|uniref:O-antigen ligase-like membrane protein n=1 Tax=Rubrivivax gelatinosus TaxID=28068 RepID=A0A4R2M4P0_RUBGE|nr:hypothetical protein [Rubrivivax gelatinosus]MBK1687684.1 hypothetical protein [Rubrivivax gelatinosus]TCP01120.1 hypothetical protein EV684_11050 [Rubrivivax gelatinosus]